MKLNIHQDKRQIIFNIQYFFFQNTVLFIFSKQINESIYYLGKLISNDNEYNFILIDIELEKLLLKEVNFRYMPADLMMKNNMGRIEAFYKINLFCIHLS